MSPRVGFSFPKVQYDSVAIGFGRCRFQRPALEAAARLYRSVGFRRVEEKPGRMWGVEVIEEQYELRLT